MRGNAMTTAIQPIPQAAVLAFKDGELCLILSSSGKQWTLPKGHIETDETPLGTALREAWEEAGLSGLADDTPIGSYDYEKCGRTYRVAVFVMQVLEVAEKWPECARRPRRWLAPVQALGLLRPPELRALLAQVLAAETAELSVAN